MAKVLLIDDNIEMQKMLQIALKRKSGHEVTLAGDGKSGIEAALNGSFEIILLDIMMPEMDGYEVARRLRSDPHTQNIPIIFVTARLQEMDEKAVKDSGVNGFVSKLTSTEEIAAKINDVLFAARDSVTKKSTAPLPALEGRTIAVFGCRGGVGATALAVNIAASLTKQNRRVCLVDLQEVSGHAALMLRLPATPSWADVTDDITPQSIGALLIRHTSSLHLFAGPTYPPIGEFSPEKFSKVSKTVGGLFEDVVINCSSSFNSTSRASLHRANKIVLVLSPEITAVQATIASLSFLNKTLNIPSENIRIVLNQTSPNLSLPAVGIEKALGRTIDISLPFEPSHASAVALGTPLAFGATGNLAYILGVRELIQKL